MYKAHVLSVFLVFNIVGLVTSADPGGGDPSETGSYRKVDRGGGDPSSIDDLKNLAKTQCLNEMQKAYSSLKTERTTETNQKSAMIKPTDVIINENGEIVWMDTDGTFRLSNKNGHHHISSTGSCKFHNSHNNTEVLQRVYDQLVSESNMTKDKVNLKPLDRACSFAGVKTGKGSHKKSESKKSPPRSNK